MCRTKQSPTEIRVLRQILESNVVFTTFLAGHLTIDSNVFIQLT